MSTGAPRFAQHVPAPTREQYYRDTNRVAPPPPARGSRSPVERVLAAVGDTAWMDDAACKGKPTEWWFEQGRDTEADAVRDRARAICERCPVLRDCGVYVANLPSSLARHGIWAGRGERARRRFRKPRGGVAAAVANCGHCGQPFEAPSRRFKYCSDACRFKGRRASVNGYNRRKREAS